MAGFFSSIGNFFSGIGRGIVRGAKAVGGFVSRAARSVGDMISKVDFSKVGDIAKKVGEGAKFVAGLGIPVISTAASAIGKGADIVSRVAGAGGKIKEGVEVAKQVGGALERPTDVEGLVGAGRRAYEFGRGLRR